MPGLFKEVIESNWRFTTTTLIALIVKLEQLINSTVYSYDVIYFNISVYNYLYEMKLGQTRAAESRQDEDEV